MNHNELKTMLMTSEMESQIWHPTSGSRVVEDQTAHGRQPDTGKARTKYLKEDCRSVIECYFERV